MPLLVSEDEKALGTGINCLTKVHPLLHVTSYASKLSQLRFSITMIESTLQQTFVGHLNTGVCIISHFSIQIHSLQCYFLWRTVLMLKNACIEQLVGRLPSEELMAKLPSFLLVLFDAFDNQNTEV